MAKVTLTIDGKTVQAEEGSTVLEAASAADIDIPTLCYAKDLEPYGGCRMCIVKVEGIRGMPPSCTTRVAEGMKVTTEDDEILQARRMVLRLLMADHPSDCLSCPANLECELQALTKKLGVREHGLIHLDRQATLDESHPVFIRDMKRCILCAKCVRTCNEVVGAGAIGLINRGHRAEPAPFLGTGIKFSNCESCGECVEHCPTGALYYREPGPEPDYEVSTICPYCGTGCGLVLGVNKGKVIRAKGDPDNPINQGHLCVKGRFGSYEFVNHPDRLKTPLVRKDGELVEASWDEALDLVVQRFKESKGDKFAALASAKEPNEDNYIMQKFARAVMKTNSVDHCARLCHASTVAGLAASFGSGAMTNSIEDMEQAEVVLVTGSNTTENHPIIGNRLRHAIDKGTKLILFDPRDIPLAGKAVIWCRQRPGTDVAWINGLMHVIIEEGLADLDYVRERCEGFEAVEELVKSYTPERVSKITGVPAQDLVEAAKLYASGKPATIIYSMGITQHTTGTDNVKSLANLAMLCGNMGKPGGGVNPLRGQNNVQGACDVGGLPNVYSGYQKVTDPAARKKFEEAWHTDLPAEAGLTITEILEAAEKGEVKALYIMGENPMLSDPDVTHVEKALKATEFLVVQDIFLTETARLADVVLPAVTFAERDGTFTNTERRVQRLHQVIPPLSGCRKDWEIICDIATRMGYPMSYESESEIQDEIAELTPSYGGITYDRLDRGDQLAWPCPTKDHPGTPILHTKKFTRGKGKFFAIEYISADELPDKDFPMVLTTGRILEHFHTGTMTRKSKSLHALVPGPYVEIHPADARHYKIRDGEKVRVSSRRGSIELIAKVGRVDRGLIFIPFHFFEAAANVLTNPAVDPVAKIPEYKVCAARLEKSA
ncbi:MAG: formate dehydrogenase subunit alpha [Deltaproteobacteria bacterium]|nr:formate dehydrogenase subunit alpha [Deltaproteobacteria bacterium]